MFAPHKRSRDEVEDVYGLPGVENKKMRTLPFRSSPTTMHTALFSSTIRLFPKPPALTPAESSEDDSDIEFRSPQYLPRSSVPAFFDPDTDMDLDEPDSHDPLSSPMWSPKASAAQLLVSPPAASPHFPQFLSVGSSSPGSDKIHASSRVPTPIYGHFATLQKTTLANSSSPTAAKTPASGVVRSTTEQHDAFLRRRRLPSPISEDENMNSPTTITKGLLRDLDMSSSTPISATFPGALAPPTRNNSLVTNNGLSTSLEYDLHDFGRPNRAFMASVAATARISIGSSSSSSFSSMEGGTGTGTYAGVGAVMEGRRRRSDAISGGGSEGGKVVFSMGFRADCDKCREKVPGHYSHVLRL